MIERRYSGEPPATVMPAGATDTQVHMYLPGFPAVEPGPPLPEGLPGPEAYQEVMAWLGIERVVVTQGNAHQGDNANLLACLDAMGSVARGVASIDAETSAAELDRLHAAGVRGARIMDLPGGAVGLDRIEAIDALTAPLGWCLAVQFDGNALPDHAERLARLESRFIIDHHGKFFAGATPDSAEVATLKRLIDGGRCWFKFAGCYESSREGGPAYGDIAAVARHMAEFAPERVIWGTNWPHNLAKTTADYPDDARLLDTVLGWLPDRATLERVLVSNPAELFGFAD